MSDATTNGSLATVSAASLDDVVGALLGLNSEDAPYLAMVEPWRRGAKVRVTWKGWESRWQSTFGAGIATTSFRLVVWLDARRGVYKFTELRSSSQKSVGLSPTGFSAGARWDVRRSKSLGGRATSVVLAPRVTATGDRRYEVTHLASVTFKPSTIKIPVFSSLRSLGWRPRFDHRFARAFES